MVVKPGYLVNPEGSNGYFYDDSSYGASHYKWYLREFETSAANNKGTLTINLDPDSSSDLVTWDSTTSNKISVGVIFEATDSKIFDAVKGNQSYGGSLNSQSMVIITHLVIRLMLLVIFHHLLIRMVH